MPVPLRISPRFYKYIKIVRGQKVLILRVFEIVHSRMLQLALVLNAATGIPNTMVYEFPADSALVAKFGAMPASSGAFQREQLFHCFSMGE